MTAQYDYDLVVVGSGSGGLSAARRAKKMGKRVAIAEKNVIGGTCVNRGCIPTKLMIYAAEFARSQRIAGDYGWSNCNSKFDWKVFKQAMDSHVKSIRESQIENLEGINILRGQAEFVNAHTLEIDGQKVSTEFVLLAVGARPAMPDIPGIECAIDSRDVFELEALAESFVIVGGGYIGVEFAQVFQYFGREVTLVESNPFVLDGFDIDVRKRVKKILEDDGVKVVTDARLKGIEKKDGGFKAVLNNGTTASASQVMGALGRTANIDALNLEAVGVTTHKGKIVVDDYKRTKEDNIFAVGDCTNTIMLTPVAKAEGEAAVETMFGKARQVGYRWVPSAVFMEPEIAMVGPTEAEASEQGLNFEVQCSTFSPLRYAMASAESMEAFIKLIVDTDSQEIMAVHLVAPRAADLIQTLVPALKKGLTSKELKETISVHPSTGEELFCLD
ncbi:MAG: FAD-dependent oxidoreductase [Phormidesmis sp.]